VAGTRVAPDYDLIYGLPFQTMQSIELTVEAVRRLRPN
jgi:coproporphyrinogen III oxidase-like Fe-S oxidoreductase